MPNDTYLLDDLFDPARGWAFHPHQVPVQRSAAADGSPVYRLEVDGQQVVVLEEVNRTPPKHATEPAMRLCISVDAGSDGLDADSDARQTAGAAELNMSTSGLPALAVDTRGSLALVYALPFSEDFPLAWLRKQMLVAIALAVEGMHEIRTGEDLSAESDTVSTAFARAFYA